MAYIVATALIDIPGVQKFWRCRTESRTIDFAYATFKDLEHFRNIMKGLIHSTIHI